MTSKSANADTAATYIRENFEPTDRLAIVLLNKRTNSVTQRLASAEKIATPEYQAWLQEKNRDGYEVYISMNALHPHAKSRTKADIAVIRHIYLDLDENGTTAMGALLKRTDLPRPNYLISTSPDKWQAIWKVEEFGKETAEVLQKSLAAYTGADPAATDCARVLRLPGFYNHKYSLPHLVTVQTVAVGICRPDHFPAPTTPTRLEEETFGARVRRGWAAGGLSQSERDWAYAKRALARGDDPGLVSAAIASYRRFDKHNPKYYADLTVAKAIQGLRGVPAPACDSARDRT